MYYTLGQMGCDNAVFIIRAGDEVGISPHSGIQIFSEQG